MKITSFKVLKIVKAVKSLLFSLFYSKIRIFLDWDTTDNWGDKLSPCIVEMVAGKRVYKPYAWPFDTYFVIGSILGRAKSNALIWGAGFISNTSAPLCAPKAIYAVRGPLTREVYLRHGIECPKIYGDPAILLGIFLPQKTNKAFKYGIIPHYIDKDNDWVKKQLSNYQDSAILIDIQGEILDVIRQICSCQYILSSSLHGLICADVYQVNNIRIVLSDNVIGGDFKFHDYRMGVCAQPHAHIVPELENLSLRDLEKFSSVADVSTTASRLLEVCPFKKIIRNSAMSIL